MTLAVDGLSLNATLGGRPVDVLRDLSFAIKPGQIIGLVGESGAGKSMIGRVIARNLPGGFTINAGSVQFDGQDLANLDREALRARLGDRIAFIPQEPLSALNPLLTIARQFGEHLTRLGLPATQHPQIMRDALQEVRLKNPDVVLTRYPFQLSGGMCQRILIAMAFVSKPALIIADEPTTALDVSTQATIVRIIRRLQQAHGTALLFITHDLRLAANLCDEILVLYAGEVVEKGPAADILLKPVHPYTKALKAANPPLDGPLTRLVNLPDQMPGLAAFADLPGCRFAPRCPSRNDHCAAAIQPLREISPGHHVRSSDLCIAAASSETPVPRPAIQLSSQNPILTLEALAKHYPGGRNWLGRAKPGFDAVKRVDLTVRPGEFVGIVGESGSGKSTVAKLIMGLETPTGGRILLDGQDMASSAPAMRSLRLSALQMVFQDPQSALNHRRPIERLVTQGMEAVGSRSTAEERHARARELLRETGLPPELIDRYPSQLSGGQKQRVNIARALCITPRLLVADEIVSGLDVSVQAQILNLLLDLRDSRGIGLIFISHDLAVVRYLCSQVLVMQQGEVVEAGETAAVFTDPQHAYTRSLLAAAPPDWPDPQWPPENA